MSFTPQDVITEARRAIADTRVTSYRYDDTALLGLVNQTLQRMALLRPDLFSVVDTMTCVAGALQTAPAESMRIMEVLLSGDGHAVNEVNRETMDLAFSTWQVGTTGQARDWMRHVRSPNRFFVFPPSPVSQTLTIEYAESPTPLGLTDVIPHLPDAYFPCVLDGVVWLAESVDNEHVNSGRAKMFQDTFYQGLGITSKNKDVTDFEPSNLPPAQVT